MSEPAPIRRQSLSARVHARLRADILSGRLAAGDAVPSERTLSESLGVNRHAVREALKRLQQAGLVRISQGGATRVLDWRTHGGLDLLFDLTDGETEVPSEIVRAVLEMRATIGVDAARRCSERAPEAVRREIAERARTTARATRERDRGAYEQYEHLWMAIVDGSANLGYRLALNSLLAAARDVPEMAEHLAPGDPDAIEELGRAIDGGDEAGARAAAARLLEASV